MRDEEIVQIRIRALAVPVRNDHLILTVCSIVPGNIKSLFPAVDAYRKLRRYVLVATVDVDPLDACPRRGRVGIGKRNVVIEDILLLCRAGLCGKITVILPLHARGIGVPRLDLIVKIQIPSGIRLVPISADGANVVVLIKDEGNTVIARFFGIRVQDNPRPLEYRGGVGPVEIEFLLVIVIPSNYRDRVVRGRIFLIRL